MVNSMIATSRHIALAKFPVLGWSRNMISGHQTQSIDQFTTQFRLITHQTNTQQLNITQTIKQDVLETKSKSDISNQAKRYGHLKVKKVYETRLVNGSTINLLKMNHKHCLMYDEEDVFVKRMIAFLGEELNLNHEEAKKYFFKLNLMNTTHFNQLFDIRFDFEHNFRMLKRYLTRDQLLNEFELIREVGPHFRTKLNIYKAIGLRPSLNLLRSFSVIMNQKVDMLNQLEISKHCLIDSILTHLNLTDELRNEIHLKCGRIDDLTIIELLNKIKIHYIHLKTNFKQSKNEKVRGIHNVDLINIDKVLNFIVLKFSNTEPKRNSLVRVPKLSKGKFQRIEFHFAILPNFNHINIFKMNYDDLTLLDNYLKQNDLEFVWQYFFKLSHLFINTPNFIKKIDNLLKLQIPKTRIERSLYLLIIHQGKLDFFISNFGETFFEYPYLRKAFDNYEPIIYKFNELGEKEIKNLSFSEFMNKLRIPN